MRDPCFITVWSVEEPQYFYQSIKKVIQILIFFKETELLCTLKMYCVIVVVDL